MSAGKLATLFAFVFLLGCEAGTKKSPQPQAFSTSETGSIASQFHGSNAPLKRSNLRKEEIQDLRVWRFYNGYDNPTSPGIVGFTEDNRFYAQIAFVRKAGPESTDYCVFHSVSKVEFNDLGSGRKRMAIVGEPEFLFDYGHLNADRIPDPFDTAKDEAERTMIRESCFSKFTLQDFAEIFRPYKDVPKADFSQIESQNNKQVFFGIFQPEYPENARTKGPYEYNRWIEFAWAYNQGCLLPGNDCLP